MNEKDIMELATKVAPRTKLSISEIKGIIEEINENFDKINSLGYGADCVIDEDYLLTAIWIKTTIGQI